MMRAWVSKIALCLIVVGALAAIAPRALAETQTENIVAEMRTYLYLQVAPDAAQSFIPSGWTLAPISTGAAKDAKFGVPFHERKLGLDRAWDPLQDGRN